MKDTEKGQGLVEYSLIEIFLLIVMAAFSLTYEQAIALFQKWLEWLMSLFG